MKKRVIKCFMSALIACTLMPAYTVSAYEGSMDISSMLTDDIEFSDGGVMYTDKYKIAYEKDEEDNGHIIIYNIPYEDTLSSNEFYKHFRFNLDECTYALDIPIGNRVVKSGDRYSFYITNENDYGIGSNYDLIFIVEDELPCTDNGLSFTDNDNPSVIIEDVNERFGFNVGKYVYSDSKLGDFDENKIVDVNDLTILSLYLLKDTMISEKQKVSADVNCDGVIDISDLATLKQYVSKQIESFN